MKRSLAPKMWQDFFAFVTAFAINNYYVANGEQMPFFSDICSTNIQMMKKYYILFALCAWFGSSAFAQQVVKEKMSKSPLAFSSFVDAKILRPFGRYTKAKANIFLKNSTLVFVDSGKVKQAFVKDVVGVEFGDSVYYTRIDSMMGRVIARDGYNMLVRVTTVNMERYRNLTQGGENLPFFEIAELNWFLDIQGDKREESHMLPLMDTYYFVVDGIPCIANEKKIKKIINPDMKKQYDHLMYNPYWSWKDEESLKQLFPYFRKSK